MSRVKCLLTSTGLLLALVMTDSAQAVDILFETFDNDSAFTKSDADSAATVFFSDEEDTDEYWGINDPTGNTDDYDGQPAPGASEIPAYTGFSGKFVNGEDIDGHEDVEPLMLTWSNLNISGLGSLNFSGLFAARGDFERPTPIDPEENDYIRIQYRINSDSGEFTNLLWFSPETTTAATNPLRVDPDFDEIGTGTALTLAAQSFNAAINATGSTLDLRVLMGVDGNEEFAFDSLRITGSAAYRLANPTAHTPEPINFGNFHVGDTAPSQALSLTNDVPNDGFSEALNASIGSPTGGVTTNGGSFSLLAPGATNNSSLAVGINTATAGNKSGTATITLASDGTGSSGNGQTPLPSQTVNVTGSVFRLASTSAHTPEPVNFGILHVGDPMPSQLLTLTNLAANDGFSERLNATIGTATGDATTNSGSFNGLVPGGTNNTSLSVGIDTSSAGNKSGTATIALTSNGAGTSGLVDTALASQVVNVSATVNNFAVADIVKLSGNGTFTMLAANEFSLDLGSTFRGSADLAAELGVVNDAAAPADDLAGDFTITAADFATSGFEAFTGLSAGNTHDGLSILLDSATVGTFNGQIVLQPRSTNPNPFTVDLPAITIHLTGEVRLPGDYNLDGTVDAADYVVWRKNGAMEGGYETWQTHFGEHGGGGAGGSVNNAVPEPGASILFVFAAAGWRRLRR